MGKLKDKLQEIGGMERLKKNFDSITKFFKEGFESGQIDTAVQKIGDIINVIWTISEAIGWVIGKFQEFQTWVDSTAEKMGPFGEIFRLLFSFDPSKWFYAVIESVKQLGIMIPIFIELVKIVIVQKWNEIKLFTETIWNTMVAYLVQKWNELKMAVIFVWTFVKEFFFNVLEAMGIDARKIWSDIKNFLSATWEGIKTGASKVWEAIKDFFQSNADNIRSALESKWESIKAVLSGVWEGLKKVATEVWNNIKDAIDKAIKFIQKIIDNVVTSFNNFKQAALDAWDGLKDWMGDLSFPGLETLKGLISDVVGFFGNLKDAAVDAYKAAKEAISASGDAKQYGGSVTAGKPYVVGEKGPELFVPSQSGNIRNQQQLGGMGGGTTININVSANTKNDAQSIAETIRQVMASDQRLARLGINV